MNDRLSASMAYGFTGVDAFGVETRVPPSPSRFMTTPRLRIPRSRILRRRSRALSSACGSGGSSGSRGASIASLPVGTGVGIAITWVGVGTGVGIRAGAAGAATGVGRRGAPMGVRIGLASTGGRIGPSACSSVSCIGSKRPVGLSLKSSSSGSSASGRSRSSSVRPTGGPGLGRAGGGAACSCLPVGSPASTPPQSSKAAISASTRSFGKRQPRANSVKERGSASGARGWPSPSRGALPPPGGDRRLRLDLGPLGVQSEDVRSEPVEDAAPARKQRRARHRVDDRGDRIDDDVPRPNGRRFPSAPLVGTGGEAEKRGEVLPMLDEKRGAQLLRSEQTGRDQDLAVAPAGARRFLAALVDGDGVQPLVREEHVGERVEPREQARPGHVAGAEERADLSRVRALDRERAARACAEDRRYQFRGARLAQVTLGERGKKLERVQSASLYRYVPDLTGSFVQSDPRAGGEIQAPRARFGNHGYTHPPFRIPAQDVVWEPLLLLPQDYRVSGLEGRLPQRPPPAGREKMQARGVDGVFPHHLVETGMRRRMYLVPVVEPCP